MAHQLPAAVARQLRVRVERDHIFIPRNCSGRGNRGEPIISSRSRLFRSRSFPRLRSQPSILFHLSEAAIAVEQEKCALPSGVYR